MSRALRKVDGVIAAKVSLEEKRAEVQYLHARVTPEALLQAVEKAGFSGRVLEVPETDTISDMCGTNRTHIVGEGKVSGVFLE